MKALFSPVQTLVSSVFTEMIISYTLTTVLQLSLVLDVLCFAKVVELFYILFFYLFK